MHTALVMIFGGRQHAAKLAAQSANTNARAAKNWLAGENGVSLEAFINLARNEPAFQAEARLLIALDAEQDPEFSRALAAFIAAWQARR